MCTFFPGPPDPRREVGVRMGCSTPVSCTPETAVWSCTVCRLHSRSTAKRQPDWVDGGGGDACALFSVSLRGGRKGESHCLASFPRNKILNADLKHMAVL